MLVGEDVAALGRVDAPAQARRGGQLEDGRTITLTGGTQAYRLGTRNTSTNLQVHDGETNILAGLIQRDRTHSNTGVPGLNELPLVNRLFGAAQDNDTRTEIVLLITPRIVRSLNVPGIGQQEFLSGTEASTGAGPIQLGQPGAAARPGTGGATNLQPVQPQRPSTTAPILPPRPANAVPGAVLNGVPQMTQPGAPQFSPPSLNPSTPGAAQTVPAAPPALTPPSLVPTSPGT